MIVGDENIKKGDFVRIAGGRFWRRWNCCVFTVMAEPVKVPYGTDTYIFVDIWCPLTGKRFERFRAIDLKIVD